MKFLYQNSFSKLLIWLYKASIYKIKIPTLKVQFKANFKRTTFGKYNNLYENVTLFNVALGDYTYVSPNTEIRNAKIGKFCSIGPNCYIGLGKHPASGFVSTHPIFYSDKKQTQKGFSEKSVFEEHAPVEIGNDVWVGANSVIADGVKIGDGAIVAFGAAVAGDVPPYAVVGGVPAKVIKYRFEKEDIKSLLAIKWWNKDIEEIKNHYQRYFDISEFLKHELEK